MIPPASAANGDYRAANRRTGLRLVLLTLGMFGVAAALVPFYDVFCEITGLNGKTGRISEASLSAAEGGEQARRVRVEFVANVNQSLPLEFVPLDRTLEVATGEIRVIRYRVHNRSAHTLRARAVPSVAPSAAAQYFNKVECFCFTEQLLSPGESREMPARFVIDPALPAQVRVVTLAYTFFADRLEPAAGDAGPGQQHYRQSDAKSRVALAKVQP